MKNAFNRILLGLDMSPLDSKLVSYLALLNQKSSPAKSFMVHVSYAQQLPVVVGGRYTRELPDKALMKTLIQRYEEAMTSEVGEVIDPVEFNAEFTVLEGTITQQMLQFSAENQVDLTLLGKKRVHQGSGVAASRYLRHTNSSVLFVPEASTGKLDHLMIGTDLSPYNEFAIRRAITIANSLLHPPKITLLHVYDVPTDQAFKISRTAGQYAQIIRKENAEEWSATIWSGLSGPA